MGGINYPLPYSNVRSAATTPILNRERRAELALRLKSVVERKAKERQIDSGKMYGEKDALHEINKELFLEKMKEWGVEVEGLPKEE